MQYSFLLNIFLCIVAMNTQLKQFIQVELKTESFNETSELISLVLGLLSRSTHLN